MRGHATSRTSMVTRDPQFSVHDGHEVMERRGHAGGHGGSRMDWVTGCQSLRLQMRDPLSLVARLTTPVYKTRRAFGRDCARVRRDVCSPPLPGHASRPCEHDAGVPRPMCRDRFPRTSERGPVRGQVLPDGGTRRVGVADRVRPWQPRTLPSRSKGRDRPSPLGVLSLAQPEQTQPRSLSLLGLGLNPQCHPLVAPKRHKHPTAMQVNRSELARERVRRT